MNRFLSKFKDDESGAVSADWVAITAAIVILSATIGAIVRDDTMAAGDQLGQNVAALATE